MIKLLITGKNGYVASSLFSYLREVYDVTMLGRDTVDLTNGSAVGDWFSGKYFDAVIHTAIVGGHRLQKDSFNVLDMNLQMYYNLLDNRIHYDKIINIGSGAELYDINNPYGFSKYVIQKSVSYNSRSYNTRVFALFDENELNTRFIKANILRYIKREPILIHQNKLMDFFYMQDFIKVIKFYIESYDPPKEIDCVYKDSYTLSDVANIINSLSDHTVPIHVNEIGLGASYIGLYTPTDLLYNKLEDGIKTVYNNLLCKI
jgi:dTDP-4-dehydrorhamnose reductase